MGSGNFQLRACVKAKIHYTSFPVASPQQVRNKLAWTKVRCVVSFPKFHYNDLLPTCCGLVGRVANKSAASWQIPAYGEAMGKRV